MKYFETSPTRSAAALMAATELRLAAANILFATSLAHSAEPLMAATELHSTAVLTVATEVSLAAASNILTASSQPRLLEVASGVAILLSSRLMVSLTDESTMAERTPEGVLSRQASPALPSSETPIAIKHRRNPHLGREMMVPMVLFFCGVQ